MRQSCFLSVLAASYVEGCRPVARNDVLVVSVAFSSHLLAGRQRLPTSAIPLGTNISSRRIIHEFQTNTYVFGSIPRASALLSTKDERHG